MAEAQVKQVGSARKRPVAVCLALALIATLLGALSLAQPAAAASSNTMLVAGLGYMCALDANSHANCWGDNSYGQLGDGTGVARSTPAPVSGGLQFTSLYAFMATTCGLTSSGQAYCWGFNNNGNIGDGTNTDRTTPTPVSGGLTFSKLAPGNTHTCGLTAAGTAYCWGMNQYGQVGDTTSTWRMTPTLVSTGLTFSDISAGSFHTCAVATNGSGAYCWGYNGTSQVQSGTSNATSPVPVWGSETFKSVSVGTDHSCALDASGAAFCWGDHSKGQLGVGSIGGTSGGPMAVAGNRTYTALAVSDKTSCAISGATTYCWGDNSWYMVGDGTTTNRGTPVAVVGAASLKHLALNYLSSCGVQASGRMYCWGNNGSGNFGVASPGASSTAYDTGVTIYLPVNVTSQASVAVDATISFTVAGHSGACNGFTPTGTATGTTVALGRVQTTTRAIAAQDLSYSTNSLSGMTVRIRSTQPNANQIMSDGLGHFIPDAGGSIAGPAPINAGTPGFGFNVTGGGVHMGSVDFASVPVSGGAQTVMTSGVPGSSAACINYVVAIGPNTVAGTYQATVVYTAVPSF